MNDALDAAVSEAANALYLQYQQLQRHYDSTYQEKKKMIEPLSEQLRQVRELQEEIINATRNTHVGAPQCCEALDSVIKKLSDAIGRLERM